MATFEVVTLPMRLFAFTGGHAAFSEIAAKVGPAFDAAYAAFQSAGIEPQASGAVTRYAAFDDNGTGFQSGFFCRAEDRPALEAAGFSVGELGGRVMVARHTGSYDQLAGVYDAMQAEMRAQGEAPADSMWEVYLSPPETPVHEMQTEVFWPLMVR
ncbi:GyrI-like domain-containing protein [Afifella pfennigii]|uniref:GyrI-like domain-containing protein n=1 Tax=Afifella pfennigii TaxID=209897 RepID=UPI000557E965|nr:GyrI-like domain-containing protein [Afifella pfennigii]